MNPLYKLPSQTEVNTRLLRNLEVLDRRVSARYCLVNPGLKTTSSVSPLGSPWNATVPISVKASLPTLDGNPEERKAQHRHYCGHLRRRGEGSSQPAAPTKHPGAGAAEGHPLTLSFDGVPRQELRTFMVGSGVRGCPSGWLKPPVLVTTSFPCPHPHHS